MSIPLSAEEVFDRDFLEVRAKLVEVAAAFDRLNRASGDVAGDPRMDKIRQALQMLLESHSGLAEEIQLIFSRPYEDNWQADFDLEVRR
ncbi:MAG: hypothetical protein WBF93_00980 [Pirellulales bacterium]